MLQAPPAHATAAALLSAAQFTSLPQTVPQLVVAEMLVSQPFVRMSPSQSAKPTAHVPMHPPDPQVRATTPAALHMALQEPQLFGSLEVSMHVALAPVPQVVSVPHDTRQVPPEHMRPPVQALPHAPQFKLLLLRLTSQPFAAIPSQFAKPALQLAKPHTPAEQYAVAFDTAQMVLQVPQFVALVVRLASQPLAATRSQSPYPGAQDNRHTPAEQLLEPLATPPHAIPHPPQFAESLEVSVQRAPQRILGLKQAGGTSGIPRSLTTSVAVATSGPATSICASSGDALSEVTSETVGTSSMTASDAKLTSSPVPSLRPRSCTTLPPSCEGPASFPPRIGNGRSPKAHPKDVATTAAPSALEYVVARIKRHR